MLNIRRVVFRYKIIKTDARVGRYKIRLGLNLFYERTYKK